MNCPVCKNEQKRRNLCCVEEIGHLRRHIESQSRLIEKLEDEAVRAKRSARVTEENVRIMGLEELLSDIFSDD